MAMAAVRLYSRKTGRVRLFFILFGMDFLL